MCDVQRNQNGDDVLALIWKSRYKAMFEGHKGLFLDLAACITLRCCDPCASVFMLH